MCKEIAIKLIAEAISLWSMTGVPVLKCTYDVNHVKVVERQVGFECSEQPKKIPDKVLKLAMFNACAGNTDKK